MSESENRAVLVGELRRSLFSLPHDRYTDQEILAFCKIPEVTLQADLMQKRVPFGALKLHYFILGLRALRAVARGRMPDGSVSGAAPGGGITPPRVESLE
jgi:hypothetical protein